VPVVRPRILDVDNFIGDVTGHDNVEVAILVIVEDVDVEGGTTDHLHLVELPGSNSRVGDFKVVPV
jgi:hypothetical protein